MIRTAWAVLNGVVSTFILSIVVIVAGLIPDNQNFQNRVAILWSRWLLWAAGARVRIEGRENIRLDAPQIFASNHASWYDVWALAAYIPKRYRFVAKKELQAIPLFGRAWTSAGHISVDRGDRNSAIATLEAAGDMIRRDKSSIVIFPEGTRSPSGELLPFKKGAFMLALHTRVDIVPVGIVGSRHVLPKGRLRVRSGEIVLRFGKPIPIAEYGEHNREQLVLRVRRAIEELVQAP